MPITILHTNGAPSKDLEKSQAFYELAGLKERRPDSTMRTGGFFAVSPCPHRGSERPCPIGGTGNV